MSKEQSLKVEAKESKCMRNKYFVGIELPKELQNSIDSLRQLYYPYGYKNVPAHITLAGPFWLSKKEEVLNKEIEQIARQCHSFKINVEKFSTFQGAMAVLYLSIAPSPMLMGLHHSLCRMLQVCGNYNYPNDRTYTPHITIANHLNSVQLAEMVQRTQHILFNDSFLVDHVCLFGRQDGQPYQVRGRYSLDKYKDLRYHPEADLGNERSAA